MDVILAAAARCLFSKTLAVLGVRPDPAIATWNPAYAGPSSLADRSSRAEDPAALIPSAVLRRTATVRMGSAVFRSSARADS